MRSKHGFGISTKKAKVNPFPLHLIGMLPIPLISFLLVLNQFYNLGAYYLDAGWFSYSMCATTGQNPAADAIFWGNGSIFGIHTFFSPTIACNLLNTFINNPIISYSLLLSLGVLVCISFGYVIAEDYLQTKIRRIIFGTCIGLSSFSIGSIAYPHPEAFVAAATALGIALLLKKNSWGWLPFFIGVLGREDIGLHVALTSAVWLLFSGGKDAELKKIWKSFFFIGLSSSVVLYAAQKAFWPTTRSVFQLTYFGNLPFEIFGNPQELFNRISYWFECNAGIVGMFFLLAFASRILKARVFLLPIIASIPWIFVNILASDGAKQILTTYHGFPFLIYLSLIGKTRSLNFEARKVPTSKETSVLIPVGLWLAIFGSLVGGPNGGGGSINVGLSSLQQFSKNFNYINDRELQLKEFLKTNEHFGVDPAIASLYPEMDLNFFWESNSGQDHKGVVYFKRYVLGRSNLDEFKVSNKNIFDYCSKDGPIAILSKSIISEIQLSSLGLAKC